MLTMLVGSCGSVRLGASGSLEAYCQFGAPAIDAHADALLEDGGDKSVVTGALVIDQFDTICDQSFS